MVLTIVRCAIAFLKRSPTLYIAASAVDETPIQYPPAAPQPAKNLSPLHLLSNPPQIGRAVQQECRDRYRMPPSACKNVCSGTASPIRNLYPAKPETAARSRATTA